MFSKVSLKVLVSELGGLFLGVGSRQWGQRTRMHARLSVGDEVEWTEHWSLWYRAVDCMGVGRHVAKNEWLGASTELGVEPIEGAVLLTKDGFSRIFRSMWWSTRSYVLRNCPNMSKTMRRISGDYMLMSSGPSSQQSEMPESHRCPVDGEVWWAGLNWQAMTLESVFVQPDSSLEVNNVDNRKSSSNVALGYLHARRPSYHWANSIKALKEKNTINRQ